MTLSKMGDQLLEEPSSSLVYEAKEVFYRSFQKLNEFLTKETLCDVEIRVGGKSIKCHKVILACCSPYFCAMFTSPLAESKQKIINIKDIDESAMELLIQFAYTGKVELSVENAQSIFHAASVLQLDMLAQVCGDFMRDHLHPTNCLEIHQFAEQHGHQVLVYYADKYTAKHFLKVSLSSEFLLIGGSHLQDLISSPDLQVEDEIQVYESVMKWIKHKPDQRKDLLPGLLSKVKLPLLPLEYLLTMVENEELIRRSLECRDLLDEARDYQLWQANLFLELRSSLEEKIRPRKSYAGALFCVGGRGIPEEPFATIECYSWLHNQWFRIIEMTTRRRHVGCASAGGKIYAVGGCDEKQHLASGEVFDPVTNKWTLLSPMLTPRRGLGLCCLEGPIYAVGGLNDSSFFATVERYDINSDSWSTVASMNTPRGGVAVVALKGCLYALGGNNGPTSLNSCEKFDPHLNKWVNIPPMNQNRAGAGAAVLNGMLYVVGGFDNNRSLNSVEMYDPISNSWSYVVPMMHCRGGVGLGTLGGRMFAVGGHNGNHYLSSVEVYDPLIDKWEQAAGIQTCRAGAGIAWCPCSVTNLYNLNKHLNSDRDALLEKALS
ncbi:kelch-like protein 8 [Limulus polyphemus]|uniref:Kelch-like protein diablo n=1 Tax=Limulus polyphemus TaxID=6850 RepID=A0ABM1S1S0_LIMPO|nr:kelch-like protein 8 [Limulus polyphemus]XP_022237573.1 kelch-like protein 8 [Limulus polyphemus]XP_022237574.1 kelch-like protein 8 [Limulus polyphemus]XP_022237575.1 kelch-like protein 8 [Limulus polyphemus]XP_022237576.1 kelch-like protein 8 [Limulus polyphemus]